MLLCVVDCDRNGSSPTRGRRHRELSAAFSLVDPRPCGNRPPLPLMRADTMPTGTAHPRPRGDDVRPSSTELSRPTVHPRRAGRRSGMAKAGRRVRTSSRRGGRLAHPRRAGTWLVARASCRHDGRSGQRRRTDRCDGSSTPRRGRSGEARKTQRTVAWTRSFSSEYPHRPDRCSRFIRACAFVAMPASAGARAARNRDPWRRWRRAQGTAAAGRSAPSLGV